MLRLSRLGIRNLAIDDFVYSRGLKDYKDNKIVNATWSKGKKQYRIIVEDTFKYQVVIQLLEDGNFSHKCNCPDHIKEEGACKHVVTALFFVLNYEEKALMNEPDNPDDKATFQIIEYFSNQSPAIPKGETFSVKVTLTVPKLLDNDTEKAFVSFHIGKKKLYKIQSIRKFITDFSNEETIILGKDFNFTHGVSKLEKKSKKIIDFLIEIYEIQKASSVKFFNQIFNRSHLILSPHILFRFLEILGDYPFDLELYGNLYEDVTFSVSNPNIEYNIAMVKEGIRMDYSGNYSVIPLMQTGELLYMNRCIYKPNKRFIRNYAPFYNHLGSNKDPLFFKESNKDKFLEVILPVINETFQLEMPDEIRDKFITEDLEAIIYLDREKSNILAELRFRYGSIEFNSFDSPANDQYIILRQALKEDYFIELLEEYGFQPGISKYILENEEKIFSFLTEKVQDLAKECQVYYSESFKSINIQAPGNLKAGLSISSGFNLLELDLEFDDIPKDELKDLLNAYRIKKRFYRLKDDNFIKLDDPRIKDTWDILSKLNVTFEEIENSTIELPNSSALYLENVFENKNIQVNKNEKFVKLVESILDPEIKDYPLPKKIQASLRNYQVTGYKWLRSLAEYNLGGILADDMGLGKTLQSIVYIASLKELDDKARFMIICPSSLVYNWQDEIENFAPDLTSKIIIGTPEEREKIILSDESDIWITSYPLLRRDIKAYQETIFHTIFIDEAQYIKNPNSLNSKSVKLLKGNHKFALTGTPIENSLTELWSIFDFILPNYLFTHHRFIKRFEKPIMKEDKDALIELNKRIQPFVLRRMKKDVLQELPDKIEEKMVTDMTEEQKKIYMSYLANIKDEINSEIEEHGFEKSKIKILAALTRLRQICCHPSTFLSDYEGGSGKLTLLLDIMFEAIAGDHRILIFSQFTSMLSIIREELEEENISYFYLDGGTKAETRNEYVKRFNGGEKKVFLISLKAGGTGLNLVGADTVIHYDPWWNPAVEDQATDRAYRIGQDKSVYVLKLITKGTIEEKIYKLQQRKKELSDSIIQSKEIFINSLGKEELEDIFS